MAARPFKFLFANSTLHRMVASKLRITTQIQRTLTTTTPCGNALTLFRGTSGHFVPVISRSVTCVQHNQFSPRLFDVTRVRRYTSNLGYEKLKDEVEKVLLKAPTPDQEKMDQQFTLLELLCKHKEGQISSAYVEEASKKMTGDHLYELALAVYSLKDTVGEESIEFWAPLFRLAALAGNTDAKYTYAQMLRSGTGIDPDLLEAAKLFTDLSDNGHPYAQFALAGMYYHGIGVDQDFENAFDLYELSSKNGVDMAFSMLGNMYMNGQAVEQSNKLALQFFQMGAKKGDPAAELSLAHCYSYGKGVSKNLKKAFEHHLSAATKGHPIGLYNAGTQYFSGKGVDVDMEKAAEFFEKAADLGFDLAQINLGNMYYNGLGVEKDWNRARELYRQAAMTNKNAEALLKELEEDERKMNESKPEE